MHNPTLPPSLGSNFKELDDRITALENGDRSLNYRQSLTTNDAINGRMVNVYVDVESDPNGNSPQPLEVNVYSAALVNPKYPVAVARFHVDMYGSSTGEVQLKSFMGVSSRNTTLWQVSGKTAPDGWRTSTFELAWLHGMQTDEWDSTDVQSVPRRGNIEIRFKVKTAQHMYDRGALTDGTFTPAQSRRLFEFFATVSNKAASFFREPEYVFLAPLSAFPMATPEGTLITGSNVPGYPVVAGLPTLSAESAPEPAVWPDVEGTWPLPPRNFDA